MIRRVDYKVDMQVNYALHTIMRVKASNETPCVMMATPPPTISEMSLHLKIYTAIGLSPLHDRVVYLFDSCENEYHICDVDNLYISAKFFKDTFNHNKKINLHVVIRHYGHEQPESVLQEYVSNKKDQEKFRGTVRAAELIGDKDCP